MGWTKVEQNWIIYNKGKNWNKRIHTCTHCQRHGLSLSLSNTHMHRAAFYSMHIGVTKSYMELLKTEFLAMGLRKNGKFQDKAFFWVRVYISYRIAYQILMWR